MTVDELIKNLTALPGNMQVVVVDYEGNVQDIAAFTRGSWTPTSRGVAGDVGELEDDEFIQDRAAGEIAAIVVW